MTPSPAHPAGNELLFFTALRLHTQGASWDCNPTMQSQDAPCTWQSQIWPESLRCLFLVCFPADPSFPACLLWYGRDGKNGYVVQSAYCTGKFQATLRSWPTNNHSSFIHISYGTVTLAHRTNFDVCHTLQAKHSLYISYRLMAAAMQRRVSGAPSESCISHRHSL